MSFPDLSGDSYGAPSTVVEITPTDRAANPHSNPHDDDE